MQAHLVPNAILQKANCWLAFFIFSLKRFLVPAINNSSHYDADFCSLLKWSFFIEAGLDGSGKNKKSDFSYWAWSTPWGHVLSLKSFCWNPVLSWAIRYSVFQRVKFGNSSSSSATQFFQLFDIWLSSLDILNDF